MAHRTLLIGVVASLSLLACTAFATAAVAQTTPALGNQTVESTQDDNPAGMAEAFEYTATTTAATSDAQVYVDSGSSATSLQVGVYSDAAGEPGALLASGSLTSPQAGAWNDVPLSSANLTSGTGYWIALLGAGGDLNFRDVDGGSASYTTSSRSDLAGLPETYPARHRWDSGAASVYINGTAPADSAEAVPPWNTALPEILGDAQDGQTVTTTDGDWTGDTPMTFTYQWRRCFPAVEGPACFYIPGATSQTYTVQTADVGDSLQVSVTAENDAGIMTAIAGQTDAVQADGSG